MKKISYVLLVCFVIVAYRAQKQTESILSISKEIHHNKTKTIKENKITKILSNSALIPESDIVISVENENSDIQVNDYTADEDQSQFIELQENDEHAYAECDRIDPDNTPECVIAQQTLKEATIQALKERSHFDQKYIQEYYQNND